MESKGYTIYSFGKTLQLNFNTSGCRYKKQGSCIMCNYGNYRTLTAADIDEAIQSIETYNLENYDELVIDSSGSILDTLEFDSTLLEQLVNWLKTISIKNIIFETHCSTITEEKLTYLISSLKDKTILIEMGLESSNEDILLNNLRKTLSLTELEQKINLIHSLGLKVILNVLFGTPGLTKEEQILDTLNTIIWSNTHNADSIVLFPINIKPGTELYNQYINGEYTLVTHYEILELLNRLSPPLLDNLHISWYGDRQKEKIYESAIPPYCKNSDYKYLITFYEKLNTLGNSLDKHYAILDILTKLEEINNGISD